MTLDRRLMAEWLGTFSLLATVVGSGIMAERLAGGNVAVALLGNTIPTGAILVVLITVFGPISGAHFNPAVTLSFALRREIAPREAALYVMVQILGGIIGVLAAHVMFEHRLIDPSTTARTGIGQWVGEFVATFGLIGTILACLKARPQAVPMAVGLYINGSLLVHLVHLVCQPSRYDRTWVLGYICRNLAGRYCRIYCDAIDRSRSRDKVLPLDA